eukprot:PhF_6_TR12973/c0_g1_i1/m.20502
MSLTPRLPIIEMKNSTAPERKRRFKRTTWPAPVAMSAASKPSLLTEIEAYIQRETVLLQKNNAVSEETTFQIYRESFSVFSTHFHEYSPFLARVLQQFDSVLLKLHQISYQNTLMENDLKTIHEHHDAMLRISNTSQEKEVSHMKRKIQDLDTVIASLKDSLMDSQKNATVLRSQLDKKEAECEEAVTRSNTISQALREQSLRQGKLFQQMKKLRQDNVRLQALADTYQQQLKTLSERVGSETNDNTLADGLEKYFEPRAKNHARKMINVMKGGNNNDDMLREGVGRYDCDEDVKEEILSLQGKVKRLQRSNLTLEADNRQLKDRIEKMIQTSKEQPATPRARWKRVMEFVPDLFLNLNQSSDDILSETIEYMVEMSDKLKKLEKQVQDATVLGQWLEEEGITEHDVKAKVKTFIGLGTGPHVPVYLRYHGPVRNRRLKKGEIEGLLEEMWKERKVTLLNTAASDVTFARLRRVPFETYFFDWLQRNTGSSADAIELAYNIIDGCERYRYDPDCEMFLNIVRGQLSEEIYVDQLMYVETLRKLMQKLDKENTKVLPRPVVFRLMSRYFTSTSNDDLMKLRYALMTDFPGDTVNYAQLFHQTEHGDQSRFVILMREIHLRDCVEFSIDVEESIRKMGDTEGNVSLRHARDAITTLDPKKSEEEVNTILALGSGTTLEQLQNIKGGVEARFPMETFLSRLRMGLLILRKRTVGRVDCAATICYANEG